MDLIWGKGGSTIFDHYSIHHIIWFMAITLLVETIFKKKGIFIAIGIAILWEILEYWISSNFPSFPFAGKEEFVNKVIGDPISDLIGFVLADICIRKIKRRKCE